MSPPFVACRICLTVEGKLKNYTDNKFLIKAYEELSGCPFVEWTYLTKFCPECACLIRKVYKFRRKCRKSYKFVTEHLEAGKKITKQFIRLTGTRVHHKTMDLSTWNSFNIQTIDNVHNPKAYKTKKKNTDKPVFHIKHLTVPKDCDAEIPTVPEPKSDFNESYYDSSDVEDELYLKKIKNHTPANVREKQILNAPRFEPREESEELLDPPETEVESALTPEALDLDLLEPGSTEVAPLRQDELLNEDIDVKIEHDMTVDSVAIGETADQIENAETLDIKQESEIDPDNLTLQEIKAEMLGATGDDGRKGERRKKSGKRKEKETRVSKECQRLQKRARRHQSNQELVEHFTITQFDTEDEQMQEFLKRKDSEAYTEGKYKCDLCLKSFKEQKWMDAHKLKHELSAGSFACNICHIRCRTAKLYRTHRDSNHTTRYACRRCPYLTYSKAQALKHHGWHEGVEHTCQHCGATFRKHTTYMGHLRRAHPSAHICGMCARSFVSAYGLNLHIKAVHKDINKLENDSTRCEDCDVTFVSRQMYVRHLLITDRHKDTSKDILGCRKCGEQFESKEDMEKHTHSKERKYVRKDTPRRSIKCDECPEVFSHPNGVYQHYLREHPDTPYRFAVRRHYLCEQCGKTFKSPGLLQQHGLAHLGLRPPAAKKPPGRNSCRVCGKTYSKLSGLFRHKLTHLGVRRHKCHICDKAFTDTSNLKQHVQGVHLNIRRIRKR